MFSRILVPLDGSIEGEGALPAAAALAEAHNAELHLVLVEARPSAALVPALEDRLDRHDRNVKALEALANELRVSPGLQVVTAVLAGDVATSLATYAAARHVDLIVMTTRGRTGWSRAWSGSVADDLLHRSPVPILLVRQHRIGARPRIRRVLIALEHERDAHDAALLALDAFDAPDTVAILTEVVAPVPLDVAAEFPGSPLVPDTEATMRSLADVKMGLDHLAATLRPGRRATIESMAELAEPGFPAPPVAATIARLARRSRADIVALTTHERGWTRFLVASVADRILDDTDCMLFVCHADAAVPHALAGVAESAVPPPMMTQ